MTPQEIFEALAIAGPGNFPRQALFEAVEQREAITPLLLEELRRQIDARFEPANDTPGYWRHLFAFYLLAYFREPAAYPLFVEAGALCGETLLNDAGEMITEDYKRQLAGVCGGDLSGIKRLIEDPAVNEYVRSAALGAIKVLFLSGELERGVLVEYLRELLTGKLEEDEAAIWVWTTAVKLVFITGAHELLREVRRAYELGLVDTFFVGQWSTFEKDMEEQRGRSLSYRPAHHETLLNHPADQLSSWVCFQSEEQKRPNAQPKYLSGGTPKRTQPKVGRNDPCPCGSGKKYKKCCGV
jgi:hypothetical protein